MRTLRTVGELRAAVRAARDQGRTIGLVPTMGGLHDGHLALVRQAREDCDEVVVSLFVNPRQFDDPADLAAYPRDEMRDASLLAEAGADLLFAPAPEEVYPDAFATTVTVRGPLTETLEGEHRGTGHFDGVATVVTKLFTMSQPDVAYFGAKDAQQVLVIRRVVADLDLPVRLEVVPTVREPDGLALSSRNVHLGAADRERALGLAAALGAARARIAGGETDAAVVAEAGLDALRAYGVDPEYLAVVDPDTLGPLERINGRALVAVAARVGSTRLIDNVVVESPARRP